MDNQRTINPTGRVLLIYTGGTIGMGINHQTNALEPLDFNHLVSNLPTFLAQRSKEIEVYRRNAERVERDRERQRWAARAVSHEVATQMYEEALKRCNNDPQRAIEYLKKSRS